MRKILTVTTPAVSLQLLTIAEMRTAAGVTDGSQDDALNAMGLRVSATIAAECRIAAGSGGEPTLLQERLSEAFRSVDAEMLILSRRHKVSIVSVTEDGVSVDAGDYEVEAESGIVYRLYNDEPRRWCASKIVVVYDAGFATVPADLKMAAMDFFRLAWQEKDRDPSLKAEEIDVPGVERVRRDFWIGALPGVSEGPVPETVAGQLKRFRNAPA